MEYIKELLRTRANALLPATVLLSTGGTLTGNVAFVNDNAVGIAVGGHVTVVDIGNIVTVI